jgi:hypothetical protein
LGLLDLPANRNAPGCPAPEPPPPEPRTDTLEAQKETVSNLVCQWLYECDVRPVVDWRGSKIDFQLGTCFRSLVGAIGIQLLSAVLGHGFAICSGCGGTYPPTREFATLNWPLSLL